MRAKHGEERIVKRFLFLPKCLPNKDGVREERWLEFAYIRQRWGDSYYQGFKLFDINWENE